MNTPDNLDEFTEAVVGMSQQAKAALCQHLGGPADSPPILLWQGENDLEITALPMPSDDDPQLMAPNVLAIALKEGFIQFGKPQFVAFISEAFMKLAVNPKEAEDFRRGDLQRKYQEELDPTIMEIISIYTFSPSETRHKIVTVKYNDDGMPEFGRHHLEEDKVVGGAIAHVVDEFRVLINAG